jgi:hypothetical protein
MTQNDQLVMRGVGCGSQFSGIGNPKDCDMLPPLCQSEG